MKSNKDWNVTEEMGAEFKNGIFELRYCKRGEKPENGPAPILWNAAVRVGLNKPTYTPQEVADVLERFSNSALAVQARKLGKGVHVFDSVNELCTFFQRAEGETRKLRALEKAREDWNNKRAAYAEKISAKYNADMVNDLLADYDEANPQP